MYNSTKAKWNFHAVRRCTSHTAFGVSMERVFGVTVFILHLNGEFGGDFGVGDGEETGGGRGDGGGLREADEVD